MPASHHALTMGLFDALAKQAVGSLLGGRGQPADILLSLFQEAGGLPGLMERFQKAGLEEVFTSWVSLGENKPLGVAQMEQALGGDAISGLAGRLGLDSGMLKPLMSQFLPQVIDRLTPEGRIDQAFPSADQLQGVLADVMRSGLGGLFGGRS